MGIRLGFEGKGLHSDCTVHSASSDSGEFALNLRSGICFSEDEAT